jgi:hypothetical protein
MIRLKSIRKLFPLSFSSKYSKLNAYKNSCRIVDCIITANSTLQSFYSYTTSVTEDILIDFLRVYRNPIKI